MDDNKWFYWTKSAIKAFWEQIQKCINTKQDALVSGENIKTINGESIVGAGDISISSK